MKTIYLSLLLFVLGAESKAQFNRMTILASNQTVSFPVTGMPATLHSQFHPGLDVCLQKEPLSDLRHRLNYSLGAGLQYHRFFQTGIRLYAWGDYTYTPNAVWRLSAGLGAGYLHAFPDYQRFRQEPDGSWKKIPALHGRPQLLAGAGMGISRALKREEPGGLRLELRWRTFIQLPFAGSYIPMLPSNAFMLGISAPFRNKKGGKA